jgi:hypothetical protein
MRCPFRLAKRAQPTAGGCGGRGQSQVSLPGTLSPVGSRPVHESARSPGGTVAGRALNQSPEFPIVEGRYTTTVDTADSTEDLPRRAAVPRRAHAILSSLVLRYPSWIGAPTSTAWSLAPCPCSDR